MNPPSIYDWPDGCAASEIESFTISSGNLPIREYHFHDSAVTGRNRINGSRDGGLFFPPGFFEGKTVRLTEKEVATIRSLLERIDFREWITEQRILDQFGNDGFCITEMFSCQLSGGKRFKYIGSRGRTPKEFDELFQVLDKKCPGPSLLPERELSRKLYKVLCPTCAKPIRPYTDYCSVCGETLTSYKYFVLTMIEVDLDETVCFCRYCGNDISFGDSYCRHCGMCLGRK